MQCPTCGTELIAGELFCDNCGADLRGLQQLPPVTPAPVAAAPIDAAPATPEMPPQTAAPLSAVPPAPAAAAAPALSGLTLVIKENGATFDLEPGKEITIGRTDPIDGIFPEIDLTPHDSLTGVSRRHAAIHQQGGQWFIRDLNSTNYTLVNRQRVQPGQDFLIEPGDEIRFGRLVAVLQPG